MTISNLKSSISHIGDGATTIFTYDFNIPVTGDEMVTLTDTTTGVEGDALVRGTDYTINGLGSDSGGSVTMTVAPTTSQILNIYRAMPLTQDLNLTDESGFLPSVVMSQLDKIVMMVQQTYRDIKRAFKHKGTWGSAIVYAVNDTVKATGGSYICLIAHTSGTFATDLAAGKWAELAADGATGATGATGAKGDTGAAGTNGTDGAAATIAVGTVTTGAAGSSATVNNSGSSSAAVFDFSIPKGDKGDTGDTGPAGSGTGDMLAATYDPAGVATQLVGLTSVQTLTNKTLTSPVINTPTGIVKGDVGLGNVDNTSDANKPVSTATSTALGLKAPLASPALTGSPTAPTQAAGDNSTKIATTAYTDAAVAKNSGQTLAAFFPTDNEPPSSNYATFDVRNGHPVLTFPDAVVYAAIFTGIMPKRYAGGNVNVIIDWMSDGTSTNKVCFSAQLERMDVGTTVLDADSFGTQVIDTTGVAGSSTSGIQSQTTIALTTGAQMDSVAAGDTFRLKITRETGQTNDTNTGNIQVTSIEIREA